MAGSGRYELHLVSVDSTVIDEITGSGISTNNSLQVFRPLGAIDPTAICNFGAAPAIRFSTLKLDTALDTIGIAGLDVSTSLELGFVELTQGGGHESAGHKITAAKCLIVPNSLVANQDGACELSYIALPYSSDGSTHPLAHTGSLPTGTPAVSEVFTINTVTVNGTPLGKPISWNFDFGLAPEVLKSAGNLHPTDAVIRSRNPVCEVVLADLDELSTARLAGGEVSTVVFNIKKMSTIGAGYQGSGDKSITMAKANLEVTDLSGSFPGESAVSLRFTARKDSGAIIAVA